MRQDLIQKFCNVVDFVFDYEPRTLFTAVFRHIFQTVCTRHRQCQMWSLHYHTHTQHSLKIYTQIFLARTWQYRWVKGNIAKLDNLPPSLRQISRCVLQSFVLRTLQENGKPATVTAVLVLLGDRGHITKESSVSKCPQADWNVFS